ncbi:MAG: hypothetical protein Ct9H300mP11_03710 [Chloroflexota bacterium]|nr:MAG: hypothetical protein Ct9H300mP11_03710 [Chloroflexota bacterium]
MNDPAMLVSAMAYATENIGLALYKFGFPGPLLFIRSADVDPLGHLTKGRVAWNIVTSYLPKLEIISAINDYLHTKNDMILLTSTLRSSTNCGRVVGKKCCTPGH